MQTPRDSIYDEFKAANQRDKDRTMQAEWRLGADYQPTLEKRLMVLKAEEAFGYAGDGRMTYIREFAMGTSYILTASSREELRSNLTTMGSLAAEFIQAIDNGVEEDWPVEVAPSDGIAVVVGEVVE